MTRRDDNFAFSLQVQGARAIPQGAPAHGRHHLLPQRGLVRPPAHGPLGPRQVARPPHPRNHPGRRFLGHA